MQAGSFAIVGCGFAGAAAALFLSRAGHEVTLFEQSPKPSAVGAGILVQPTGMRVLEELGLLQNALARASRVDSLHIRKRSSHHVLLDSWYMDADADGHDFGPDFGLGIHRGAVFQSLYDALVIARGVDLHTGVEVTSISDYFTRPAVWAGSERLGQFDAVIVASGAQCTLHHGLPIHRRSTDYAWGALWRVVDDPDPPPQRANCLLQTVHKHHGFCGLLPTGTSPAGVRQTSVFWSQRLADVGATRDAGIDAFCQTLRAYHPEAEALFSGFQSMDEFIVARYRDTVLSQPFWGNVGFIGCAAHATSPQLGQGANLGLVDALVLRDALGDADDVQSAFTGYWESRRRHIQFYQWATRATTALFQTDHAIGPFLRDLLFPFVNQVPWARSEISLTMQGLKSGLLGPTSFHDLKIACPRAGQKALEWRGRLRVS